MDHAAFSVEKLSQVEGLRVVVPQGAMYLMVEILLDRLSGISDDIDFAQQLMAEESVFVLPAKCFGAPNFFRIVFCAPQDKLAEAYDRIGAFCKRRLR